MFPRILAQICERGFFVVWRLTLSCDIEIIDFELQSRRYVHIWTNNLQKDMNPLMSLDMG